MSDFNKQFVTFTAIGLTLAGLLIMLTAPVGAL